MVAALKAAPFTGQILNGGGTTFVEPLMERWAAAYEKQYAVGSTTGRSPPRRGRRALNRVYAFGCTNVR